MHVWELTVFPKKAKKKKQGPFFIINEIPLKS